MKILEFGYDRCFYYPERITSIEEGMLELFRKDQD